MSAVLDEIPGPAATPAQRAHRRSVVFLRWLRRIHLYVGLWGAALGFLFGVTGVLMNHRAVLKIPVEKHVQRSVQLSLPSRAFANADEMGEWLKAELKFDAALQGRVKADAPKRVTWADREMEQPARWTFNWQSPHRSVNAEYYVGNRFVKVETQDATPLGTLMRLHTASGVGAFWVLLSDTIAGALIVLSVTGLLMWTRLRPLRITTVSVSLGALLAGTWFLWSAA
jgi:uncharacterized protein